MSVIFFALVAMTAAGARAPAAVTPRTDMVGGTPICNDVRYAVGINLPDARDLPSGDIRLVEAILDGNRVHIGYLYVLNNGRAYVSDRSRTALTMDGLATMNEVVNQMSSFAYNAFDPRDNGYTVYPVTWRAATAGRLHLTTTRCLVKTPEPNDTRSGQ